MLGIIKGTFLSKKVLSKDVYEFSFQCSQPSTYDFLPGQYLIIIFSKDDKIIRKFYSISSSNKIKDKIEFVVKIIENGLGSTYLSNLKEGDNVEFQGPAGLFYLKQDIFPKIFVATGTGIAPMVSMIKSHLGEVNSKIKLVWGLRTKDDIYYLDLLQGMAQKYENFSYEIYLSREVGGGRVNIGIDKVLNDPEIDKINMEFYISGDRNIVDSIRSYLIEKQILPENIKLEKFI